MRPSLRLTLRPERRRALAVLLLEQLGGLATFSGRFFRQFWRRPFEGRELVNQMDEVGTRSFLLTAVTGLAIGVVLAMQSRGTLVRFGAEANVGSERLDEQRRKRRTPGRAERERSR